MKIRSILVSNIPTRYANAHVEGAPYEFYDRETAEEALQGAAEMVNFVKEVAKRWTR